jgi:hypothetical protein
MLRFAQLFIERKNTMTTTYYLEEMTGNIIKAYGEIRKELGKKRYTPKIMTERFRDKLKVLEYGVNLGPGAERRLGEGTYGIGYVNFCVNDEVAVQIHRNKGDSFTSLQRTNLRTYLIDADLPVGLLFNFPQYITPVRVENRDVFPATFLE